MKIILILPFIELTIRLISDKSFQFLLIYGDFFDILIFDILKYSADDTAEERHSLNYGKDKASTRHHGYHGA